MKSLLEIEMKNINRIPYRQKMLFPHISGEFYNKLNQRVKMTYATTWHVVAHLEIELEEYKTY